MTAIVEITPTAEPPQKPAAHAYDMSLESAPEMRAAFKAIDRWESDGSAVRFTAPASHLRRDGAVGRS